VPGWWCRLFVGWLVVTEIGGWMDGTGRLRSQESVPCSLYDLFLLFTSFLLLVYVRFGLVQETQI